MARTIALVLGSVQEKRNGTRAVPHLKASLEKIGYKVEVVDPVEVNAPLLQKKYAEYEPGTAPEGLSQVHDVFEAADGYVFLSPEYNHSIPPALSNLLDYFKPEFARKVVGLVGYSTGPFAGQRAMVQLRAMAGSLGLVSAPDVLPIPNIQDQYDIDGKVLNPSMEKFVSGFASKLSWYVEALAQAREA